MQEISDQHVELLGDHDVSGYWWYAVRAAHVRAEFSRARPQGPSAFLDLGCGTGGMLAAVIERFAPQHALGLDGTQTAVDVATSRGLEARYADFRKQLDVPFAPDAVTCLDVLEHLEDPVLALRNLRSVSTPDATLVVTVPAHPHLHSRWDDLCGHYRRYTRASIAAHLTEGGWTPQRVRYFFAYCWPPAWVQRRLLKRDQTVEFPPVSPLVNRLMTWAGTVERTCGCPLPFGTSLLAVASPTR